MTTEYSFVFFATAHYDCASEILLLTYLLTYLLSYLLSYLLIPGTAKQESFPPGDNRLEKSQEVTRVVRLRSEPRNVINKN